MQYKIFSLEIAEFLARRGIGIVVCIDTITTSPILKLAYDEPKTSPNLGQKEPTAYHPKHKIQKREWHFYFRQYSKAL
jgi:hypothetical protein